MEQPGYKIETTYLGGRQVRQEIERGFNKKTRTFTVSPKPNQIFEGRNGRLHTWRYYSDEKALPWGFRLLKEARDLDEDGTPNLFVDYVALTINKTKPADWPD